MSSTRLTSIRTDLHAINEAKQRIDARLAAIQEESARLQTERSELEKVEKQLIGEMQNHLQHERTTTTIVLRVAAMNSASTVLSEMEYQTRKLASTKASLTQIESELVRLKSLPENKSGEYEQRALSSYEDQHDSFIRELGYINFFIEQLRQKQQSLAQATPTAGHFSHNLLARNSGANRGEQVDAAAIMSSPGSRGGK